MTEPPDPKATGRASNRPDAGGGIPENEILARLLAGTSEPSVLQRERIFEAILENLNSSERPARSRFAKPLAWAAVPLTAAAAAMLWIAAPREGAEEYRTKGGEGSPPGAALRPLCFQAPLPTSVLRAEDLAPCTPRGRLVVEVRATPGAPYVAIFARRFDGEYLWFFPNSGGLTPRADTTAALLPQEFPLDGFLPGRYVVTAAYFERPMDRQEVARAIEQKKQPTERALEVDWIIEP